jgi:hypothetical protein
VELDAVADEDEHLAVERHRHPVPKQLRILRHLPLTLLDRSPSEDREEDDSRLAVMLLRVKGRWGRLRRAVGASEPGRVPCALGRHSFITVSGNRTLVAL